MKDFDNPDSNLQKKLVEHIQRSGFPFEWKVRDELLKAQILLPDAYDSWVNHSLTYIDPEDNILREYDLNWFIGNRGSSQKNAITWDHNIECKVSDKYHWIFFSEPNHSHWHSHALNLELLKSIPEVYADPVRALGRSLHYGRVSTQAYSYITFPDNSEMIRSAIFQAVKPTFVEYSGYIEEQKKDGKKLISTVALHFPVVVYSGYLFEFQYDENGGKLLPARHVVFQFQHSFSIGKRPVTFLVDIVRSDYLPEFLVNQISDITLLGQYIVQNNYEPKAQSVESLKQ